MRTLAYALKAEFLKRLQEQWHYKLNYFSSIVATFIFFLGLVLVVGGDGDPLLTMVMGFLFWFYGAGIIDEMVIYTVEEAQLGTLEQIFVTRTPVWAMLISKLIAMVTLSTARVVLFLLLIVLVQQDLLHYIGRANWGGDSCCGLFHLDLPQRRGRHLVRIDAHIQADRGFLRCHSVCLAVLLRDTHSYRATSGSFAYHLLSFSAHLWGADLGIDRDRSSTASNCG